MLVSANDLTGALDSRAPFAAEGDGVCVMLNHYPVAGMTDEIASRDLDTCVLDPSEARAVFRTIGSTLRNNVAAKIESALASSGVDHLREGAR